MCWILPKWPHNCSWRQCTRVPAAWLVRSSSSRDRHSDNAPWLQIGFSQVTLMLASLQVVLTSVSLRQNIRSNPCWVTVCNFQLPRFERSLAWTSVFYQTCDWCVCALFSILCLICVLFISSSKNRNFFCFDGTWFINSFFHGVYFMVAHLKKVPSISNHKDLLTAIGGCVCKNPESYL